MDVDQVVGGNAEEDSILLQSTWSVVRVCVA